MNEFFKWLSSNSLATTTLIVSFGMIILSIAVTYLVAFFQGREISFWPPKIGPKIALKNPSEQTTIVSNQHKMTNNIRVTPLAYRKDVPDVESFIKEATDEIWISGIDLNVTVNFMDSFIRKVQEGICIKFLAVDIDEQLIKEIGDFRGVEPNSLIGRMKLNFDIINKRLILPYPDKAEFRVFKYRPSIGYFIIDPYNKESGKMNVSAYMFHAFSCDEPLLHLSQQYDSQWFEVYLKDFEKMWNSSSKYLTI
ncbi:MAG: hypothetical protein JW708_09080 [Vallitaleaceae bacterium]|nr:hypothetical protein [Vallitaleaceae bacterium]